MTSLSFRAHLCVFISICIAFLPACGGGGGGTDTATTPASSAPVIRATQLASGTRILTMPSGETISYFVPDASSQPTQALMVSGSVKARVYFNGDGTVNKAVDENTGAYLVMRPRSDVVGADYLAFNSSNAFVSGVSVSQISGVWYSAPILGGSGQSAAVSSSVSAGQFVYGSQTALPSGAQALLNTKTTTASLMKRFLDRLVPSAYAQTDFTTASKVMLGTGGLLIVVGGLSLATAPVLGTLIVVAGCTLTFKALWGKDLNLLTSAISSTIDQILGTATANSYGESPGGGSTLDRVGTVIRTAMDQGVAALSAGKKFVVEQATSLVAGQTTPAALPDPTPAVPTLPPYAVSPPPGTGGTPIVTVTPPATPATPLPPLPVAASKVCKGTHLTSINLAPYGCTNIGQFSGFMSVTGIEYGLPGAFSGEVTLGGLPEEMEGAPGVCTATKLIQATSKFTGSIGASGGNGSLSVQGENVFVNFSFESGSRISGTLFGNGIKGSFSCSY